MTAEELRAEREKLWAEADASDAAGATGAQPKQEPTATAAQTPAAATEQPAQAAAAPAPAEAKDPYAGLDPLLADKIRGMESMLASTQTQLRQANGHIGGLTSQLKTLREASAATKQAGGDAPSAKQLSEAQGDAGAMAKLKQDYPEFAAALDAAMEEKLQAVKTSAPAPEGTERTLTRQEFNDYLVETKHSGWKETVATAEFRGWLQGQPQEVKLLGASESPQDAIRLLDLHKQARTTPPSNQARLDAAAAIPNGRAVTTPREKSLDKMSKAELWAYLDEQDRLAAQQPRAA